MLLVWVLTVLMAITSVRATSALDLPLAIRRSTSSSRGLSGSTSAEDWETGRLRDRASSRLRAPQSLALQVREGRQEPGDVVRRNPACVGGVEHRRHHRAFIHKAADAAFRRGECERALKRRQCVTARPLCPLPQRAHDQDVQHTAAACLRLGIRQQPIEQIHRLRQQGACRLAARLCNPDPRQDQLLGFAREADDHPQRGGRSRPPRRRRRRRSPCANASCACTAAPRAIRWATKPRWRARVDIGFQRPLCGGVVPARVLEARQSQIAEGDILGVHDQRPTTCSMPWARCCSAASRSFHSRSTSPIPK